MDDDPPAAATPAGRGSDIDACPRVAKKIPRCRSTLVAEQGVRSAGHDRRQPMPHARDRLSADRVHAAVQAVEATRRCPVTDGARPEPDPQELPASDHTMLTIGKFSD